ncbi:hypothetical protein [Catellatospora bangladeshensis]|uniref:Uncharacterized protein n=1 Tax=Catellatospora bangladeshensis TaxID=310355 RepID=A0A8J3JRZ2_9ACTN|nr:hypothetical protein [Catellatospora bangladeshensis]GIF85921.1 hypothetical protein Cba03nite_72700 [Catellatospora bangladeshensis]
MKKSITSHDRPVDGGPAPVDGLTGSRGPGTGTPANDGGSPPAWLVDGIAAAGGLTSTSSSQRGGGAARDAGGPPRL